MKPIYLTLILTLLTLTSFTQTLQNGGQAQPFSNGGQAQPLPNGRQPQFKFWLAFEDSLGQRDTIWVMSFDVNEQSFLDSVETSFMADTADSVFTVYKQRQGTFQGITKVGTYGINLKSIEFDIQAQNYHLPITVRWDSSLLRNNGLPWEGVYGFLSNHFIFINIQFTPYRFAGLDKFNSIELLPFQQGGGMGNHFPLKLKITEENIYQVGVNQLTKSNSINIYPNPTQKFIQINTSEFITYQVYNASGKILFTGSNKLIDLTQITQRIPQILFIKINTHENDYIIKKILFIP